MTKDIKQIQEENRKAIICAVHGTDDYEEALEKEFEKGCVIEKEFFGGVKKQATVIDIFDKTLIDIFHKEEGVVSNINKSRISKIIGKPLTLDRVLLSLSNKIERSKYVEFISLDNISNGVAFFEFEDDIESTNFNWDLAKPTLEQQTEETQRAIWELLNNN